MSDELKANQANGDGSRKATSQAVVAMRSSDEWISRSRRSFIVRIDGRRAGKIKPGLAVRGATEFTVEPGTHTVSLSMGSRPLQVVVKPGSRAELVIRRRAVAWLTSNLPFFVAFLIAGPLSDVLLAGMGWWARMGLFLAVYLVSRAGFTVFSDDYREMSTWWVLEPAETSSPQEPVGSITKPIPKPPHEHSQ